MKCSNCGSEFVTELHVDDGATVLMHTKNNNIALDSGTPVRATICIECKALSLFCDSFTFEMDGKTYTF